MNVNFQVKKRTNGPKAEMKMIARFQKLSQVLLRELHWKALGYRKPSELKQLRIRQKKRKIKKLEAESPSG